MHKTLATLSNDWSPALNGLNERQGLLVEKFCYMSAVDSAKFKGLNIVPVDIDEEGILAESLESVLENWDYSRGKRPHLMYTVSTGQNPTGGVVSAERRKKVYDVCNRYDVIIIEDEPYWFLQYPAAEEEISDASARKSSGYKFLDSLVQSYLEIDTDGRVVRLDTFSKNVAPGCRLGWITAQPALIEKFTRMTEGSTQQPSGFVQSMIAKLVGAGDGDGNSVNESLSSLSISSSKPATSSWSFDGWVKWLDGLRDSYQERMVKMCQILEDGKIAIHDSDEVGWSKISKPEDAHYEFKWPRAGMFVWLKVHLYEHPLASEFTIEELANSLWIWFTKSPNLILISPGRMFCPSDDILPEASLHYRICFAAISEDLIESTTHRIPVAINTFWNLDSKTIKELIESTHETDINSSAFDYSSFKSVFGC